MRSISTWVQQKLWELLGLFVLVSLSINPGTQANDFLHHPKVESALEQAARAVRADPTALSQAMTVCIKDGLVKAVVQTEAPQALATERVCALGGNVIDRFDRLVKAWLPLGRLWEVADLPGVVFIRRPYTPVSLKAQDSPFVSEGVTLVGGTLFHSQGVLGRRVRVAVIDVGFASLSYAMEAGEFPDGVVVWTRDYTGQGLKSGGPHGTGVAEIVHDVAPGAALYLAKVADEVGLGVAVEDCIREGVDIIVHSVGWANTNFGDGTGVVAEVAHRASAAGILWVNAAGNHARKHWLGQARDEDGDSWVEFSPGLESLELTVDFPGDVEIALTWNEWPRANTDLDLFLLDEKGLVVATSENRQAGWEPPSEELTYAAAVGRYLVKIKARYAFRLPEVELYSMWHDLTPSVAEKSILAPGNVPEVLTVGAIHYRNWKGGPQEPFSSHGPSNVGLPKPDTMAPDGVTTFVYEVFSGTSAAAPHAAGAAALLLARSRNAGMDLTSEELRIALIDQSADMGPPGPDPVYGAGKTQLVFGQAWAQRFLSTLILGDRVAVGDTFLGEVTVGMPPTQLGGLTLEEHLPTGFQAAPIFNDGASVTVSPDEQTITWRWLVLDPGETREVLYRVEVPVDGKAVGQHVISGSINGEPVHGTAHVEVIEPLSTATAVSHWQTELEKVNLEDDDYIDDLQMTTALSWWEEGETVPGTGQTIDFETMQRLVGWWLAGQPVNAELPQVRPDNAVRVRYNLEEGWVWPKGHVEGTVEIDVRQSLFGMGLEQLVPQGWHLVSLDEDGAVFKVEGAMAQWLWPEEVLPGTHKKVRFLLYVPDYLKPGEETTLQASVTSGWPSFRLDIASAPLIVVSGQAVPFVLEEVSCTPNPVSSDGVKFRVAGTGVQNIRVMIYDLSGCLVFDSDWQPGSAWEWRLQTVAGGVAANGVYLYWIDVQAANGETQRSGIGKMFVVR